MLTLQDSFVYDDPEPAPVGSAEILVSLPQLEASTDGVLRLIETGTTTLSLNQNLSSKTYSLALSISDVFGPNYASLLSRYVPSKVSPGLKPALLDFSIAFSVDYGTGSNTSGFYEALWFLKGLKYPVPAGPGTIPGPQISTVNVNNGNAVAVNIEPGETANLSFATTLAGSGFMYDANIYMINKVAYASLLHTVFPTLAAGNESVLLFIVNELLDLSGGSPKFANSDPVAQKAAVTKIIKDFGLPDAPTAFDTIKQRFHDLLDFPLKMPKLKPLSLGGFFKVKAPQTVQLTDKEASFYHLSAEYFTRASGHPVPHVSRYTWDPTKPPHGSQVDFQFTDPVPTHRIVTPVTVKLKDFRNVDLYNVNFDAADPNLQKLAIVVDLSLPGSLTAGTAGSATSDPARKFRGKIVSLTKRCALTSTVAIVAKATPAAGWITVSAGESDQAGNFALPYPYGKYAQAEVRVSLALKTPTPLTLDTSPGATDSIPQDFLFILLPDEDEPKPGAPSKDGCGCDKSVLAGRLPSHDDLIQSAQYMQDIGGTCVNLTTPNRTLREYTYTALVRHTDPDVANYALTSHSNQNPDNPQTIYRLTRKGKIKRNLIDVNNPIEWEDVDEVGEVDLYQAVTVSTGHILYYKSEFRADGYSLGDLTYSLPLAPGQKKEIVVIDSSHALVGTETQNMSQSEQLASDLVNERDIVDTVAGNIGEQLAGQSSADTWGVSAGGGAAGSSGFVSGNVGVAGGYAASSSQASQNSGRDVAGHFLEHIKQGIHQNASSYRQQHVSVVTTVREGQSYKAETTVVANHNHCHAMTMLYFQVLRHFAVYQELVNVEECVFVPFLLTKFSMDNIPRWADILSTRLLPLPANTYMKLATYFTGRPSHPLIPAFDSLDRVRTNWALVDFPKGKYDEDTIIDVRGEGTITVNIPRPHTKYDYILSLAIVNKQVSSGGGGGLLSFLKSVVLGPLSLFTGGDDTQTIQVRAAIFDKFMTMDPTYDHLPPAQCIRIVNFQQTQIKDPDGNIVTIKPTDFFAKNPEDKTMWSACSQLLEFNSPEEMMEYYFANQLISDWDSTWYSSIAPRVYAKLLSHIKIDTIAPNFSSFGNYNGGERVMSFSFEAAGSLGKTRLDCKFLLIGCNSEVAKKLDNTPVIFRLRTLRLAYSTDHFNGLLYNGSPNVNILARNDVANPNDDGVKIYCPETAAEQRNPKLDDRYLAQRLVSHLNQHLEYYNRVLWYSLDTQRRFLLLDGFHIEVFDDKGMTLGYRSISSVVKSNLIAVIGNSLVFPVAPGYKVGASFISATNTHGQPVKESLIDFYKPEVSPPPYRLSIPTRGIYSESVIGQCDSCEKVKPDSSQDWTKFSVDESTPINAVTVPTPSNTAYNPTIKDFAQPIVSIQNAPNLPDPGSGLGSALDLLGKANLFRDVAGLDANQQNAIKTLISNNESARAYAQMASGMVSQQHNTSNSNQVLDQMKQKKEEGALDDKSYGDLVKSHFQHQIDGGKKQQAELEEKKVEGKPTPVEAAAQAGKDGHEATASSLDANGNSQSFTVKPKSSGGGSSSGRVYPRQTLAQVVGLQYEKQTKDMDCWATAWLMMKRWKDQNPALRIQDVLTVTVNGQSTAKWWNIYLTNTGLNVNDYPAFMEDMGLAGNLTPASFSIETYIGWMNDYGPLWFEIDPDYFHKIGVTKPVDHAVLLEKIEVDMPPAGVDKKYYFTLIDPEPQTGGLQGGRKTVEASLLWKEFEKLIGEFPNDPAWKVIHFKDKMTHP
ncbi:MAG: hypothetical protein M1839_002691 [Geoglossum umbratile]|nr:MAG: hypothetical protein M1839_002691 [Geoglossum umbratile]